MIKKEVKLNGGRKLIITSQYNERGKLLRVLVKSIPTIPEKKKNRKEVTSPFLKIWEK